MQLINIKRLLTWVLITSCSVASAQLITPFSIRYQTQQSGGITFISNSSVTCDGGAGCATAQAELPPAGTGRDNSFTAAYIDVDADASTFMSSSDSLALPTCSQVLFAGLYWGAGNNSAGSNWANRNQVLLKVNDGTYQTLIADSSQDNTVGFNSYHCFKDITNIVSGVGLNARFTIANIATRVGGTNRFGGWTIVIVFKNDTYTMRNLTVFEGLSNVSSGNPTTDIPISGFLTPPTGPVTLELGFIVYDGDRASTGDQLQFNGAGSFVNLSDAINGSNDVFNSTIGYNGALTPFRLPSYNNTLGYDADIFVPDNTAKNYIGNNVTSATIRQTTGGETFLTQVVTSAIDIYEPDLRAAVSVSDLNGANVEPGDTLEYKIVGKNIGSDPAINTYVTDTLEANVTYVTGSLEITAGPNSGVKTDATGDDQAEYLSASRSILVRIGTGANQTTGGQINNSPTGTDSTQITFRVVTSSDCIVLSCDNQINNRAYIYGTGNISGNLLSSGSNPNLFDSLGCPIPGTTNTTINVGACPPITAFSNSPVCEGDTIQLGFNSSSTSGFVWNGPNGFTSTNNSPIITNATSAMAGLYSVAVTIPGYTCTINSSVNVVINSRPATPTVGGNANTCITYPIVLTSNAGTNVSYSWSGPNGFTSSLQNPIINNATLADSGNYVLTHIDSVTGCRSLPATILAIVEDCAPIITDDTASVNENDTVLISVLNNDTDPQNNLDSTSVVILQSPSNGTATVVNGAISYHPDPSFNGTDTLIYIACDSTVPTPFCDTATVVIFINPFNDSPVVVNDSVTTSQGQSVSGTIINSNDFDPDGSTLAADTTPVTGPFHGTIIINTNGSYTYTPVNGYSGPDTVVIAVCDSGIPLPPSCVNDTLFITVIPGPVVVNETGSGVTGSPITGNITANDSPGATLGAIIDSTNNGSIAIDTLTGGYTYNPDPGFSGYDTLIVNVCLNNVCVPDTLVLTVFPDVNNETFTVTSGGSYSGNMSSNDVGSGLTYNSAPVSGPDHGTILINANGTFTYTPDPGYSGNDTVIVTVCDASVPPLCSSDTLFITVIPGPVVVNETGSGVTGSPITGNITANDSPGATLGAIIDSTNNGSIAIDTLTGGYTYNPDPGFSGYDTLIVNVCLNNVCVPDTLVLTVFPDVNNETFTVTSGGSYSGNMSSNDVGSGLTYNSAPVSGPDHGTILINANGTFTYTPDPGYSGNDTVIVTVCDASVPPLCSSDTLFITVIPGPVVVNETGSGVTGSPITGNITVNDSPGATLGAIIDSTNNGSIAIDTLTGGYTYNPDPGFSGYDTLIVNVCLNNVCVPDTLVLTVFPDVKNETFTVTSGGSYSGNMSSNDVGSGLTYNSTPVSGPDHGTILINANGTFTYTPDPGYSGNDTVIVTVCDASVPPLCSSDTLFITVIPGPVVVNETGSGVTGSPITGNITVNDSPGATLGAIIDSTNNGSIVINYSTGGYTYNANNNYSGYDTLIINVCLNNVCIPDTLFLTITPLLEDDNFTSTNGNTVSGNILNNDNGTGLTATTTPVTNTIHGTVTIQPNGNFTYVPDEGYCGADSFQYQACDASVPDLCSTAWVVITVTCTNPAFSIPEGFSPNGDGINELFVITGIDQYPLNKMTFFNRWGNIVYEAEPYNNTWDGTSNSGTIISGDELPAGTYFYILDLGDGSEVIKGYVFLNR